MEGVVVVVTVLVREDKVGTRDMGRVRLGVVHGEERKGKEAAGVISSRRS